MRLTTALSVCLLMSPCASAAPRVEPLPAASGPAPDCEVRARGPADSAGATVLRWAGAQGAMQIDGQAIVLGVNEEQCATDCVRPGRSGARVFHFRAPGVHARLSKRVVCGRDAEVCAGLPEGTASLVVSTARGRADLTVWNGYCDL